MDRETNRGIISYRSELRSLYHKWNHSKKSGVEHLPRDFDKTQLERVKNLFVEETIKLQEIKKCCECLINEITKEFEEKDLNHSDFVKI